MKLVRGAKVCMAISGKALVVELHYELTNIFHRVSFLLERMTLIFQTIFSKMKSLQRKQLAVFVRNDKV
jgi:hypothetical protein